MKIIWSGNI